MTLHVSLRDGFQNATVTITVNGSDAYRKSNVTTNLTISHADSIDVPVDGPTARLEVAVDGGPRRTEDIPVAETPYVNVRITDGAMEFLRSSEPIPML